MLEVSTGPYRDEKNGKIERLEQELGRTKAELAETQGSLGLERHENRILRGTTRMTRGWLLFYLMLRYGFTRSLAFISGMTFTIVLTYALSAASRPVSQACHHNHHHPVRQQHRPTMVMVGMPATVCYTHLTCHECAYNPFAIWTWGGEHPLPLEPYELEVEFVVSSN